MTKKEKILLSIIIFLILIIIVLSTALIIAINPQMKKMLETKDESSMGKENITQVRKLYLTGDMSNMTEKKDVRDISVIYENGTDKYSMYGQIKIQGNFSLRYPKKNYSITFYSDNNHSTEQKVDIGFGEQSKYCLKANWIDSLTHARNIVSARLAAKLQDRSGRFQEAPNNGLIDGVPVEVYLNDTFLGLYTWNIPKEAWMWALDEENKNNVVVALHDTSDVTCFKKLSNDWNQDGVKIEVGEYSEELKNNLNDLISFVRDSSDEEFVEHFEEHLDLESTINYVIMANVLNAYDNATCNLLMVSFDQKKWYPSLYDLDSTFGQDFFGYDFVDYEYIIDNSDSILWQRFTTLFKDKISNRYIELRKDILTKEYIMDLFEDFKSSIPKELIDRDQEKWPDSLGQDYEQIGDYLDEKLVFLDNYYGYSE